MGVTTCMPTGSNLRKWAWPTTEAGLALIHIQIIKTSHIICQVICKAVDKRWPSWPDMVSMFTHTLQKTHTLHTHTTHTHHTHYTTHTLHTHTTLTPDGAHVFSSTPTSTPFVQETYLPCTCVNTQDYITLQNCFVIKYRHSSKLLNILPLMGSC